MTRKPIAKEFFQYGVQGLALVDAFNGNILARWWLDEHLDEILRLTFEKYGLTAYLKLYAALFATPNINHLNSAIEIPPNGYEKADPAFKRGNFLVNDYGKLRLSFIIDSSLKKVVWVGPRSFFAHDVQFLSDGKFLLNVNSEVGSFSAQSFLAEYDPITERVEKRIDFEPSFLPSGMQGGSVQKLNENCYFGTVNHFETPIAFLLDRNSNVRWKMILPTGQYGVNSRLLDLQDFLKNNRGSN
jgi:hypothetical protein